MSNDTDLLRQLKNAQYTIRALQEELTETNQGLIALTLELEQREEHLRTVVTNAPILLIAIDRAGMITLAEGSGLATLGLQPAQVVGTSIFDLYRDMPDVTEHVRRALDGEASTAIERLDAAEFETHWLPLRDKNNRLTGAIGVATDITGRRRAEQRTRAALDALVAMAEAIVLTTDDATAATGGAGAPVEQEAPRADAIGERLAELTRQVLGCRHVAIVTLAPETGELHGVAIAGVAPQQAARWWRQWDRRPHLSDRLEAAHIERLHADEALILDRTQPPFPPETAFDRHTVLMVPLRMDGVLRGVLSVDHGAEAHDFTPDELALVRAAGRLVTLVLERNRLLRERAEARANELALREANRRMEEFLSVAGHELRTPLTSVLGNVQLAAKWVEAVQRAQAAGGEESQEGYEPVKRLNQAQTALRRTERQGRVLNRLVNDLLDTSRIQAGHLALRPAPCDLVALVRDAAQECQQQALQRTIELDLPDTPVPVLADTERIAQVLANYLSNAVKYSAADRPISVGLRAEGTMARVWVRDRGPGLPRGEQERVWERFYRVAGVEHQDGSSVGLGLGLYISRSIIERLGGQAGVESSPGAGATFWFTIPMAGRADAEPADTEDARRPPPSSGEGDPTC